MSSDYYSPHPRTRLERPLGLVGYAGSGVRAVARGICAVTGLPLNDVERLVEARAGRSRARLLLEDGAEALRAVETEVALQALERRPPGVIALTDSGLMDESTCERVCQETRLVYLERPLPVLLEAIRTSPRAATPEFALAAPRSVEDLLPSFREREPAYRRAEVHFMAEALHPHRVVDELVAALDLLPRERPFVGGGSQPLR